MSSPALDAYANLERKELAKKKHDEELERQRKEEQWQTRVKELKDIINNEASTIKQVNEAEAELGKMGAPYGVIRIGDNNNNW